MITGTASDGTIFTEDSPEVIDYKTQFPDVTIEAAIGSVVDTYNQRLQTGEITE